MIPVSLKNLKKLNLKKAITLLSKLTRLRLVECNHENCEMRWVRKSCVFDTFPFGKTWKHDDIRKVEVKIFLWANLEKKVKIEKFRQNDGKRVFKKEEKAFEENLNFKIVAVAYCRLMRLQKG